MKISMNENLLRVRYTSSDFVEILPKMVFDLLLQVHLWHISTNNIQSKPLND